MAFFFRDCNGSPATPGKISCLSGVSREKVLRAFQTAPVADLGFAMVDMHRALRKDFPEVIFGAGKTPEQVVRIAAKLLEREQCLLVTRVGPEHARALRKKFPRAVQS